MNDDRAQDPDQTDLVDYLGHTGGSESRNNGEKDDAMMANPNEDSESKTGEEPADFQQAMERLEQLASKLESGELPLEEAMEAYREGQEMIEFCQQRLEEAELIIQQVREDEDGVEFESKEPDS